ncbi:protein-glutamine gamma-glutamyltransferase 2 [Austrofundulus limnaeus]|uniref:protein-glutamine gamma-glutamyltransferase n=1 Tax=Austrofundulus limnaeus TaxID=52670 RepID=A0A2I4CVC2_AUSLI|nr:PREDICTED: protein-glutamine gamma-glutamyltransferase 2-like [Austrofundulus limnaeus]
MAHLDSFIINVDLRSHENNSAHRTREMDRDRLIVRRGQPFSITVHSPDSQLFQQQLELMLHVGRRNEVKIRVQKEFGKKWWFSQMRAQNEMLLTVHSPADAIVGRYRLTVLLMSADGSIIKKTGEISFHLLFNPWCRDDVVYLPDERLLQEYIMNENGLIYKGSWNYITVQHWNFGQFEDYVVDICFQLLDNSNKALSDPKEDLERRSDPVYVSRMVSAMVNSNDDIGVLYGSWSPPYHNGVPPGRWTGSVPILRQWSRSGLRPVKYGQCWVFAGVACTVLRCLGIPTRLITNFTSAHDVDGNLSVDYVENFYSNSKQDSTWNFHCWVESWMKRTDLPQGNNGWQVLDPTPQERSDGEFCCGPCPVAAIKEGNLDVKYDARFVFAEVNADLIYWRYLPDGRRQKINVDEKTVGRNISTKSVYGDVREDLTLQYKYPEGSAKEREVYTRAGRRIQEPSSGDPEAKQLKLIIKHSQPTFGTDFDVIVEVKNEGSENVNVKLTMRVMAVTYNSLHQGDCQRQNSNVMVPALQTHKEILRLQYENYNRCVSDQHLIRVKVLAEVEGLTLPLLSVSDIPLRMPEVRIQVLERVFIWEQASADISLTNPLPVPLNRGVFFVEGPGLLTDTRIYVTHAIAPGEKVTVHVSFTPSRAGVRKLLVDFDSDRLKDVKGDATVVVYRRRRNVSHVPGGF